MSRRTGERTGLSERGPGGGASRPLSTAVVEAVAAATETPHEELPSLTEVVDPDALDALFAEGQTSGSLMFRYAGHRVTVFADGTITVDDGGAPVP